MNKKGGRKVRKTKTQRGITLIALIITIVVLLILAAVAISSITNDGILHYAQNAADSWNKAAQNELNMLGDYLNYLNNMGSGSGYTEELEEIDLVERYILGPNKTGRSALEIANVDMSTYQVTSFKNDPESITDASITMSLLSQETDETGTKGIVYVRYNNYAYKIVVDGTTFFTESVERVLPVGVVGREGQIVKYDGNGDGTLEDWIVLTDRNGLVEIVSMNPMYDSQGQGLTLGGADYNTAQTSWNTAVETINDFCKSIVKPEDVNKTRSLNYNDNSWGLSGDGFIAETYSYIGEAEGAADSQAYYNGVYVNNGRIDICKSELYTSWGKTVTRGVYPVISNPEIFY